MAQHRKGQSRRILWPLLITFFAFLFYFLTLAPTVLWGDDAYYQRTAYSRTLRPDGGGHWLWLQLAVLFVQLPWGDVAFRSNLLSAVAAVVTLMVLYAAGRQAGLRREGATVAVVVLAVGHTFWMHAVRAEVYALFTVFVALHLWLWARWSAKKPQKTNSLSENAELFMGAALFGVTLLAHQMAVLLTPAWAFVVWSQRCRLRKVEIIVAAALFCLGLAPFLAVIYGQIATELEVSMVGAIWLYFTQSGINFGSSFFDFSLALLPYDVSAWLLFSTLQFIGLALVLVALGIIDRLHKRKRHAFWLSLLLFYVTDVVFAISYRVNDRYVFLLPGYLCLALFAGAGWSAVSRALASHSGPRGRLAAVKSVGRRKAYAACLMLLVAIPVCAYAMAPPVMAALDLNPWNVRTLPGREPTGFFLWPGKQGYQGARRYGEQALRALPPNAILIADHTPLETLRFLHEIERLRRDVRLVKIEPGDDLNLLLESLPDGVPVFIADNNPDYYDLDSLPQAVLVATGPVFRLERPGN